jgi:hypothetical protein
MEEDDVTLLMPFKPAPHDGDDASSAPKPAAAKPTPKPRPKKATREEGDAPQQKAPPQPKAPKEPQHHASPQSEPEKASAREQRMEGLRRELAGLKQQLLMDAEEAALRAEIESARAQVAATRGMTVPTPLGTPSRTPASPTSSTPQRTVAAAAAAVGKGSPARPTLAEASRRAKEIPVLHTLREVQDSLLPEGSIVTLEGSLVIPSLEVKTAKTGGTVYRTGKLLIEGDGIDLMVWAGVPNVVTDGTFPKTFSRLERVRVTCPQFTGKLTININDGSTAIEAPPSATVAAFPAMAPQ